VGAAAPGIGASDGSTVGSWRWKAAHHKSDWGMFCAYLDDWYARGAQLGARYQTPGQVMVSAGVAFLTLNGFIGSHGGCRHSADQYARFGVEVSDALITNLNHQHCRGLSSVIVVAGGKNYAPTDTATVAGGGGSGGSVKLMVVDGFITRVVVTSVGSGYSQIPNIIINSTTGTGADLRASGCNSRENPPWHGNEMRNFVGYWAQAFDFLYPAIAANSSYGVKYWEEYLEWCGTSFISPEGLNRYGVNQQYWHGVGPSANGHTGTWMAVMMIGEATYGDNSSDTTISCVHGETQCNELTTAFLDEFFNNDIPWWTQLRTQQNVYPNANYCDQPIDPGLPLTAYSGGRGCGYGGIMGDGIEYGPQTQYYLLMTIDIVSGADTATNLWKAMPETFLNDMANTLIYVTSPFTSQRMAGYHEWMPYNDQQKPFITSPISHASALILSAKLGATTMGNYMRHYARNVFPCAGDVPCVSQNNRPFQYLEVIYGDDIGLPATNWVGVVPLDHWFPGEQWMLSRSDTSAHATWVLSQNMQTGTNHSQPENGAFKIARKGVWLALSPPGYGYEGYLGQSTSSKNTLTYQGPNELRGGGIWKAAGFYQNQANAQAQWKAAEISPQNLFTRTWFDTTNAYCRTKSVASQRTTSPIFAGSGKNDMQTYYSAGPAAVGTENVYNVVVDGNGTPDTFKWRSNINEAGFGAFTTGVPISTLQTFLDSTSSIRFLSTTGHTVGDSWTFFSDNWGDFCSNVKSAQREFVFIKPDYFVVLDRGLFASDTRTKFQISFPVSHNPTYSGGTISNTLSGQNIFIQPVYPKEVIVNLVNLATIPEIWDPAAPTPRLFLGTNYYSTDPTGVRVCQHCTYSIRGQAWWKADIVTPSAAASQVMLTVMQTADSGTAATPAESIRVAGLVCAHFKDSSKDQIACFSADPNGALVTLSSTPVSYTVTRAASSAQHYLFDLPASQGVKVQVLRAGQNSTLNLANSSCDCAGYVSLTTSSQGSLVVGDL
jgi:hypothetical protein